MTSITPLPTGSLRASRATALTRFVRISDRLRNAWMERKTLRALEGMPMEIRKDIGWPTSVPPCNPHHHA